MYKLTGGTLGWGRLTSHDPSYLGSQPPTPNPLPPPEVLKIGFQKVMLLIIVQMWFIDDLPLRGKRYQKKRRRRLNVVKLWGVLKLGGVGFDAEKRGPFSCWTDGNQKSGGVH